MDDIAAVRLELSTFSAGQPKAVQGAVANLDGWLFALEDGPKWDRGNVNPVNILACTARAVETLESALRRRS